MMELAAANPGMALAFTGLVYLVLGFLSTLIWRFRGIPNLASTSISDETWGGEEFEVIVWILWTIGWPVGWFLAGAQYALYYAVKLLAIKL